MAKPGRKPGTRKAPGSGRRRGSRNRRTVELQEAVAATVARVGLSPFEVLALLVKGDAAGLRLPRGAGVPIELRFSAARELASYIAPKLRAITVTGEGGGPVQVEPVIEYSRLSVEERATVLKLIEKAKVPDV